MAAPSIDTSRLPLLVVHFNGFVSEAEFDLYLASMTRLLERRTKTITILDARKAIRNPPSQRRKQAEWLKTHEALLREYSLGTVFVITSPLVRGVVTAILWLQPLPTDHAIVGTLAEAEAWAMERLKSAGLTVPPATTPS